MPGTQPLHHENSTPVYRESEEPSSIPSSANSVSDKENHLTDSVRSRKSIQTQAISSSGAHMSSSNSSGNKRQRLTNRASNIRDISQPVPRGSQMNEQDVYDPDQDTEERRRVRKGLRDLTRELYDSRSEYLQAGNNGLYRTVRKANEYFNFVKQTSDATIDSRLLVNAADMSYKKTAQLALGDSAAGIDVDEFVSKCISYMRRGVEDPQVVPVMSTQHHRRSTNLFPASHENAEDSDEDAGDAMNWDWIGRTACFRHNCRPSVSGFLLGPLSVQKRSRQQSQRRARERIDPSRAVAPQELEEKDLDRQETSNLTSMCSSINKLLARTQRVAEERVNEELSGIPQEDITDELLHEVMDKYRIADDGGVPLFHFCINPRSFGQSVENLFYISFLVRDGTVGISTDSKELPTLHAAKPYAPSEARRKGVQKHQAVFSLDFDTWRDLIEAYGIKESIIPHREEQPQNNRTHGWYS